MSLFVGSQTRYLVNSEGTRLRTADQGVQLSISMSAQADDGAILRDGRVYRGLEPGHLPPEKKLAADIDEIVARLRATTKAPVLKEYTGPVLFEGVAAGQVFDMLLTAGLLGLSQPVGMQRTSFQGARSLARKLGKRILPTDVYVSDDPSVVKHGDEWLLGHYRFDDEGVPAQRVNVIEKGIFKELLMSRVPTKKRSGSNGHGRAAYSGADPSASIGCLFVECKNSKSEEQLRAAMIEAAKREGLDHVLRVKSMRQGSSSGGFISFFGRGSKLPDPILVYRVYIDGREEQVRGCEFGEITPRSMRHILAMGKELTPYNSGNLSIVAPAVLFDELDLSGIEQEHDKRPILPGPHTR